VEYSGTVIVQEYMCSTGYSGTGVIKSYMVQDLYRCTRLQE